MAVVRASSLFSVVLVSQVVRRWHGALVLAILAAMFGSLTQLQFKALAFSVMEGLTDLFDSGQTEAPAYRNAGELVLQLVTIFSSAIAQVGFLNYAISAAPVAYSVPAYQSCLLFGTLALSGFLLGEYAEMSALQDVLFWLGAGLVLTGMLLNAWGLGGQNDTNTASGDGEMVEAPVGKVDGKSAALLEDDAEAAKASQRAASAKFS